MATTLLHKRSSVAGDVPGTSDLQLGEFAVNTAEGHVYLKVDDGTNPASIYRLRGEPLTDVSITLDNFNGDDVTTDFTLSRVPEGDQFIIVTINGVTQHTDAYSYSNTTLTFSEAPETGDAIEVRIFNIRASSVNLRDYTTYVYTISSSTTSISGADDDGDTLVYDIGMVEVYYNGVRLVQGPDYTANDGTTISLNDTIEDGTIEVVSLAKASFVDQNSLQPYSSTLSGTSQQLVDRFLLANYRSAKYLVQMTNGTDYHTSEVSVLHDGTDVYITEYGTMYTASSLGTITADISGDYVRLLVTPANVSNTVVKGHRLYTTV